MNSLKRSSVFLFKIALLGRERTFMHVDISCTREALSRLSRYETIGEHVSARNLHSSMSPTTKCASRMQHLSMSGTIEGPMDQTLSGHSILFLAGYLFAVRPTRDRIIVSIDRTRSMSEKGSSSPQVLSFTMLGNGDRWSDPD